MTRAAIVFISLLLCAPLFGAGREVAPQRGPFSQIAPTVATDGVDFLITWLEPTVGRDLIVGRVVGSDVAPRSQPFVIATVVRQSPDTPGHPAVASNGSSYVVVWDGVGGVQPKRVSSSGVVLDSEPLVISPTGWAPAIASDGTDFFVTWEGGGVSIEGSMLSVDRWSAAAPHFVLVFDGGYAPRVVWNGKQYVVAYTASGFLSGVKALGVSSAGIPESPILLLPALFELKALATDGQGEVLAVGSNVTLFRAAFARSEPSLKVSRAVDIVERPQWLWNTEPITGRLILNAWTPALSYDGANYICALKSSILPFTYAMTVARISSEGDVRIGGATLLKTTSQLGISGSSNILGATLFAASAVVNGKSGTRILRYDQSDFDPLPPPPATPFNVQATGYEPMTVTWDGGDGALAFLIERNVYGYFEGWYSTDERYLVSNLYGFKVSAVRVRALNLGGLSAQSAEAVPVINPRRRHAVR